MYMQIKFHKLSWVFLLVCFFSLLFACNKTPTPWSPGWRHALQNSNELDGPESMEPPRLWAQTAKHAMVAAANPLAVRAGLKILKLGGTAADAMLAISWVLNVVEPQSSGIGGGGFILYYDKKNNQVFSYDGREEAPKNINPKQFLDRTGKPVRFFPNRVSGGKPVGVPGLVSLMQLIKKNHGSEKISWMQTFHRAIELADDGFRVSPRLSQALAVNAKRLNKDSYTSNIFLSDGKAYLPGEILVQKDLANTFKILANKGYKSFYNTAIANDIIDTVHNNPWSKGSMELSDLKNYTALQRPNLKIFYRGYEIFTMPPPSSAVALLQAIKILERFSKQQLNQTTSLGIHLKLEAEKLAFADRAVTTGDPDFNLIPLNSLLNKNYTYKRSLLIKKSQTLPSPYFAGIYSDKKKEKPHQTGKHTTHISIIDSYGNALSSTITVEFSMGSGIAVKNRGFLLNNELTDFSPKPGAINSIETGHRKHTFVLNASKATVGGKRPRSSMSPVLIFKRYRGKNNFFAALGSPGGSRIPGTVHTVIQSLINQKLDMQQAINLPRALHRNSSFAELELPWLRNKKILKSLKRKGHIIKPNSFKNTLRQVFGGVQGVMIKDNELIGGADLRREGTALGY